MKNEHIVRWKTNNLQDFYTTKLKNISDKEIEILYKELYISNKKNGNNYNTIGLINFHQDGNYDLSINSGIDRKVLEPHFKEFKFEEVEKYCYIMFNSNNKENIITRIQYPWIVFSIKLSINYVFKNYNPQEIYKKIKDINLELIIKLIYGKLRESILQQSMLPNSKGIIKIIFPDGKYSMENIIIENIYDSITFTDHTGISIPDFEEKLDICIVFQYITAQENSYYQPIVIPKYKCLKSIENRRKLFENFKIKDCDTYSPLQHLYNEQQSIDIKKFTIPNDTFYIETRFSNLYYDKGTIIYDYKFSNNIISKIKNKQKSYSNSDKKKFGNVTLDVDEICKLLWIYNYKCDGCGINICINYNELCANQFSIDRINDKQGHTFENCRLTCLDCNRLHKKNELFTINDSGNFINCKNIEYKDNKCSCINSIENICNLDIYEENDY